MYLPVRAGSLKTVIVSWSRGDTVRSLCPADATATTRTMLIRANAVRRNTLGPISDLHSRAPTLVAELLDGRSAFHVSDLQSGTAHVAKLPATSETERVDMVGAAGRPLNAEEEVAVVERVPTGTNPHVPPQPNHLRDRSSQAGQDVIRLLPLGRELQIATHVHAKPGSIHERIAHRDICDGSAIVGHGFVERVEPPIPNRRGSCDQRRRFGFGAERQCQALRVALG